MKQILKSILAVSTLFLISCDEEKGQNQDYSAQKTEQHSTNSQQQQTIAKNVNVQEFKELIKNGKGTIVDVRTPGEYGQGNIENSKNINVAGNFAEEIQKLDKNKPVYVYCRSGARSTRAMGIMREMGFKEIYNLSGGYMAWSKQ